MSAPTRARYELDVVTTMICGGLNYEYWVVDTMTGTRLARSDQHGHGSALCRAMNKVDALDSLQTSRAENPEKTPVETAADIYRRLCETPADRLDKQLDRALKELGDRDTALFNANFELAEMRRVVERLQKEHADLRGQLYESQGQLYDAQKFAQKNPRQARLDELNAEIARLRAAVSVWAKECAHCDGVGITNQGDKCGQCADIRKLLGPDPETELERLRRIEQAAIAFTDAVPVSRSAEEIEHLVQKLDESINGKRHPQDCACYDCHYFRKHPQCKPKVTP